MKIILLLIALIAPLSASERVFKIDSKSDGERIGSYSVGETITIEYVSGEWVAYKGWKVESPDSATTPQHRVVLYHRKPGGEETVIDYPSNTKGNAFKHLVATRGNYYLKIADPALDSNEGKVVYKIGTIRP